MKKESAGASLARRISSAARILTPRKTIDEWFETRIVFFLLGVGRSGTHLLAGLLNAAAGTMVFHEPLREDFESVVRAHKSEDEALAYLIGFRKRRIYALMPDLGVRAYGEVNSALRFHARAIKTAFPHARLLHLVRDGRDVVRSIMARKHYTGTGIGHQELSPLPGDPLYERWDLLSRFEKVCWLWADGNRRLRQEVEKIVKFENLVEDYAYFRRNIEEALEIEVGSQAWERAVRNFSHPTAKFSIPYWREWDAAAMRGFEQICGDEMRRLGYS